MDGVDRHGDELPGGAGDGCDEHDVRQGRYPTATSFNDSGLTANTIYRYRVRAMNVVGNSAYSAITNVTDEHDDRDGAGHAGHADGVQRDRDVADAVLDGVDRAR